MTTHGRTGAKRLLMGSVAHSVLLGGRAPLVLVRPATAGARSPATAREGYTAE